MPLASAWQSRFDGFDFSDFAQEFLRRNRDYHDEFARAGSARSLAGRRAARSWGLAFPVRSGLRRRCRSGNLATAE